jgi:16S rRNA (cytidine1402-2'-O)-methyltransferase
MSGKLYVIATPMGNLDDITMRAINTLKSVDIIFAETPNHSKRLLEHYGIDKKVVRYNDHNAYKMVDHAIELANSGMNIGLISDAGTPTIQDPGYRLVFAFRQNALEVIPIPGVSALIAALSASGLPTDRFVFLGFLPKGPIKKRNILKSFDMEATIILYESPNRLIKTLEAVSDALGQERYIVVAREITKIYEEFVEGKVDEVLDIFKNRDSIKGEFVILIRKP